MPKRYYILLGIMGGLSTLGFQPYSHIFVLFFTFSVLFWFLNQCETKKQFFWVGGFFGFGLGATSLFWLKNALLIDAEQFGMFVPVVPLTFGLLFGSFYGVSTLVCWRTRQGFPRLFFWSGAFVILEWGRSWLLTGFPWNLLGNVWTACQPVLQTASVMGVYGLSGLSILWFCSFAFVVEKNTKIFFCLALSLATVYTLGWYHLMNAQPQTSWGVTLRLVQGNIPQTLKWDSTKAQNNFNTYLRLSRQSGYEKVTHVLWPESATPFVLNTDDKALSETISALHQEEVLITGSLRQTKSGDFANSALVLNDVGQIVDFYDKTHLVPFGEYVPLRSILPLSKLVALPIDFVAGHRVKTVNIPSAPKAGILICYETIFSGQVVDKNNRPKWLINLVNDGWYGNSAGPYQHLSMAQMRAVEEGLPVVRVASTGISAVIDPYGRIQRFIPLNKQGTLDSPLPRDLPPTIYAQFGVLVPLILALMSLFLVFLLSRKQE